MASDRVWVMVLERSKKKKTLWINRGYSYYCVPNLFVSTETGHDISVRLRRAPSANCDHTNSLVCRGSSRLAPYNPVRRLVHKYAMARWLLSRSKIGNKTLFNHSTFLICIDLFCSKSTNLNKYTCKCEMFIVLFSWDAISSLNSLLLDNDHQQWWKKRMINLALLTLTRSPNSWNRIFA